MYCFFELTKHFRNLVNGIENKVIKMFMNLPSGNLVLRAAHAQFLYRNDFTLCTTDWAKRPIYDSDEVFTAPCNNFRSTEQLCYSRLIKDHSDLFNPLV